MVECTALEMRRGGDSTVSSNLTLSATLPYPPKPLYLVMRTFGCAPAVNELGADRIVALRR